MTVGVRSRPARFLPGQRTRVFPKRIVDRPPGVECREGPFSIDASFPLDPCLLLVSLARPRSRRPSERCHAVTNRCHLVGQTTDTELSTCRRRSNDSADGVSRIRPLGATHEAAKRLGSPVCLGLDGEPERGARR